jgi:hypothetical protein
VQTLLERIAFLGRLQIVAPLSGMKATLEPCVHSILTGQTLLTRLDGLGRCQKVIVSTLLQQFADRTGRLLTGQTVILQKSMGKNRINLTEAPVFTNLLSVNCLTSV